MKLRFYCELRRTQGGNQRQMAFIQCRSCRTGLQGNIFARRKNDRRNVDRIGRRARVQRRTGNRPVRLFAPRPWRGVELFGASLLLLNFIDGLYKLAKVNWHVAYQIAMTICYVALAVRWVQLTLAFRGG